MSSVSDWFPASVWARIVRTTSSTSGATSVGCGWIARRPTSERARSSRLFSSRTRWRQLSRMISTVSACCGVSESRSSISSSAKPWTEVSGLRSSCEAVRTNSSLRRSSSSRLLSSCSSSSAISLKAAPRVAVSESPPTSTRALRSPEARRPAAATSCSSGRRIEEIRPLKRSSAPVRPAISPAATSRAVSRVSPEISSCSSLAALDLLADRRFRRLAATALGDFDPRFHLHLVGAGDRVLEVLPLLDEAADADHRHRGEHGEADREPDPQPVGE